MMSEPTRLLDDPAIAEGLRADLAQAQSAVLQGLDVSAGAAGLKAAIAAETTATGAAGAGASKVLALGLAGTVTAGALVWFALRTPTPEPELAAAAPVVSTGTPEASASAEAETVLVEPEVAPEIPKPDSAVMPLPVELESPTPELAPTTRKRPRRADKQADYLKEAKLVSDARAAMKTDARAALELLTQARSEFPRGLLREEREALTILSLAKLGRAKQASASARRFLDKYSESPYAAVVRQVLE